MPATTALNVPQELRRGGKRADQDLSIESGVWLLDYMARHLGHENLADVDMLDMGCGVKFTQALLDRQIPIKHYVGVDIYKPMIDFLQDNVSDSRFEYHHMDTHNAMYNPDGTPLGEYQALPLGEQSFDIICLYSVFTHLAPHDYPKMLKLLRPYIKPDGKLIYTLFINELTAGGHGLMDAFSRQLGIKERKREPMAFADLDKKNPLRWAMYSREYALELIENTGWKVESLSDPLDTQIQHHFVCTPI